MRCIFCKQNSDSSKSVEHIVPESLGNEDHILPPGWVCDKCNNYFSRNVEAPFLNSNFGRLSRFEMQIASKKGKVPFAVGVHAQSRSKVMFSRSKSGELEVGGLTEEDDLKFSRSLQDSERGSFYIMKAGEPENNYVTARFIGKVGVEVLALKLVEEEGANDELVDNVGLDDLRNYVRRGRPGFLWPVHMRRLYPAEAMFSDNPASEAYEVLHEWNILGNPTSVEDVYEYYAVIAILGIEFTINLGGPELGSYLKWLEDNEQKSYLYLK